MVFDYNKKIKKGINGVILSLVIPLGITIIYLPNLTYGYSLYTDLYTSCIHFGRKIPPPFRQWYQLFLSNSKGFLLPIPRFRRISPRGVLRIRRKILDLCKGRSLAHLINIIKYLTLILHFATIILSLKVDALLKGTASKSGGRGLK